MKRILILILCSLGLGMQSEAQYLASGDAYQTDCNCYTLTNDEIIQVGSVWNVNLINLNNSFDFTFEVFLGCNDWGADGMAFGLQPLGTDIGIPGSGMGMGGVDPSIGVYFDTFHNDGVTNDPIDDHIAIHANGEIDHDGGVNDLAGPVVTAEMEDCNYHDFQVVWDADSQTLTVYFDGSYILEYSGDIINEIFGGNPEVYWGFTAGTGGASNEQKFCTKIESEISVDFPLICSDQWVEFVDESSSVNPIIDWSWDFGDGESGSGSNVTHSYTENGVYDIELTVTDVSGCESTDVIEVEVVGPNAGINSVAQVCPQDDSYLMFEGVEGNPDTDGYWLDLNGDPIGGEFNALEMNEGEYTYVVESDLCPSSESNLSIEFASVCESFCINEPFTIEKIDNVCFGESEGEIFIEAIEGLEYSIDNGQTFQNSPSFGNLPNGEYEVAVQFDQCVKYGLVEIISPEEVVVDPGLDKTICIDGVADLSAEASGGNGNYEFEWDGLGMGQNQLVSPDVFTCYQVRANDSNGCFSEQNSVCVDLYPEISVSTSGDDLLCPTESMQITASGSGGSGYGYQFQWYGPEGYLGSGSQIEVNPMDTSLYYVEVTDDCTSPMVSENLSINVPMVEPAFEVLEREGCVPFQAEMVNTTAADNLVSANWTFGTGVVQPGLNSTSYIFEEEGCFNIGLEVVTDLGCDYQLIVPNYICVDDLPEADFGFGPQPATVANPEIDFSEYSDGADSFLWEFGQEADPILSTETDVDVVFPSDGPGVYPVTLTVYSPLGCADTITKSVVIEGEMTAYVPNSFTPDNDGVNDIFQPVVLLPDQLEYYEFQIFNRWGRKVFSSDQVDEGWSGNVHNGEFYSQDDTYIWSLVLKLKDRADVSEMTGFVTVFR